MLHNPKRMTAGTIILIITATTTALIAGLFFAWSCSVMPGLARVSDSEFIASMQAMNRAILNPVFLSCFLGTAILLPLSTGLHYAQPLPARFWWLLTASVLYLAGVLGVTMLGNVPLNDALEAFRLQGASPQEMTALRTRFEMPWNNLNMVRTIASILAEICVVIACLSRSDA